MTEEVKIIDGTYKKDDPHKDIGKQKFRVRQYYNAQVTYDVPAVVAGASTIGTLNGRTITLGVSIASNAATNPVAITVQRNMPSQAVFAALSANPGGVIASAQLGLDGNGIAPGVGGGTATQMYWRTFTIASAIVA